MKALHLVVLHRDLEQSFKRDVFLIMTAWVLILSEGFVEGTVG